MKNINPGTIALRLAEALLLNKGEISIKDIEAIPFLDDPKDAELIASYLQRKFKTKIFTHKITEEEISGWEELIKLET